MEGNGKGNLFEAFAAEFKPKRVEVHICSDGSLVEQLANLQKQTEQEPTKMLGNGSGEIDVLKAEIKAKSQKFICQSIGRKRWSDLLAEHPPTDEDLKRSPDVDNHIETFGPAAIHLCCAEPKLTEDQAQWLWDELNQAEATRLFMACVDANVLAARVPLDVIAEAPTGEKK